VFSIFELILLINLALILLPLPCLTAGLQTISNLSSCKGLIELSLKCNEVIYSLLQIELYSLLCGIFILHMPLQLLSFHCSPYLVYPHHLCLLPIRPQITEISGMSSLVSLRRLDLSHNRITRIGEIDPQAENAIALIASPRNERWC
jgi:hypothetical protein